MSTVVPMFSVNQFVGSTDNRTVFQEEIKALKQKHRKEKKNTGAVSAEQVGT